MADQNSTPEPPRRPGMEERWGLRDAAWAVCLHAGLSSLIFNGGFLLEAAGRSMTEAGARLIGDLLNRAGASYPSGVPAFSTVLSAVMVLYMARGRGTPVRSFGFQKPNVGAGWTTGFTAVLGIAYLAAGGVLVFALPGVARSLLPYDTIHRMGLLWAVTAFCVSAPMGEELVYRGMLSGPLRKRLGAPKAFAGGLILAYAFEKTGSLAHSVAYHACGNGLLFVGYLLLQSG